MMSETANTEIRITLLGPEHLLCRNRMTPLGVKIPAVKMEVIQMRLAFTTGMAKHSTVIG